MSDSIHIDAATAAADTWVEMDFSNHAYVYVSFELLVLAAQMVTWRALHQGGPSNMLLLAGTGTTGNSGTEVEAVNLRDDTGLSSTYDSWQTDTFADLVANAAGGAWHALHVVFASGVGSGSSLDVDGASVTGTNANATASHVLLGLINSFSGARGECWLGRIKVGTTLGGSDLLNFDPATGSLGAFSATSGTVTLATAPVPSPGGSGQALEGVCIAFDDAALTASPVWTRID